MVQVSTPFVNSAPFTFFFVATILSSFRAQRLSTSQIHSLTGITPSRLLYLVLNAFRHLRSIHNGTRNKTLSPSWCSTPFDISDPFTRHEPGNQVHCPVLNAFRHLRSIHPLSANA